jgi:histidinol-phosphate/aromatic aminotransferase/cobyric acid decarboxylase-like protein
VKPIVGFLRSAVVTIPLVALLFGAAIGSTLWALRLSYQVASMSADAAATAIRHREEIAQAVARTKAKARLRRALVALPVAGTAAAV